MNRRLFAALLSALMAISGIAAVAPAPAAAAPAPGPLPACRYDDVLTPLRQYTDWRRTLLDPIYMVPRSYVPPRLVSVGQANIAGSGKVRPLVITDLRQMAAAARQAGNPIAVRSAYRSYANQASVYQDHVRRLGEAQARLKVARPGHSEHQLGTTIDFQSAAGGVPWNGSDWGQSPAGRWMQQNGWKYGFVMSYPKNKRSVTCYKYEPWHWRYVGRDVAAQVRQSGLTLREWLWREGSGVGR